MTRDSESTLGYRISPQQERLWRSLHAEATPRSVVVLRLSSAIDRERLAGAVQSLVERHSILRTTFQAPPSLNVPLQIVNDRGEAEWSVRELASARAEKAWIEDQLAGGASGAGDLARLPILRASFASCPDRQPLLALSLPTLCADAETLGVLIRELAVAYIGDGGAEATEPFEYLQFSEWQHEILADEEADAGREHWRQSLTRSLAMPGFPWRRSDEEDLEAPQPAGVVRTPVPIDSTLAESLLDLGRSVAGIEELLLSCWLTLLRRLTGERDLVVGYLDSGRGYEVLTDAVGLFARFLPLTFRWDERLALRDLTGRLAEIRQSAEEWADYFEPPPDGFRLAVGFSYGEWPSGAPDQPAMSLVAHQARLEPFLVELAVTRHDDGLSFELLSDRRQMRDIDARYLSELLAKLLESAASGLDRPAGNLEILSATERQQLLCEVSGAGIGEPELRCVHHLFADRALRDPSAIAVVAGDQALSFGELHRASNRLARHLRTLGVGLEVPVGLCLERSPRMMVALMAILKAGGAYVPLDPLYPPQRLAFMSAQSGARLWVTERRLLRVLGEPEVPVLCLDSAWEAVEECSEADVDGGAEASNLAYVLYTSGSTGRPKGVMIEHRSLINLAMALERAIYRSLAPTEVRLKVALNAPLIFDASVKQWLQLLAGRTLELVPEEVRPDGERLLAWACRRRLDVIDGTPSQIGPRIEAGLADETGAPAAFLIGGEAIERALWRRMAASSGPRFFNVYGPTECTVDATATRITGAREHLGEPLAKVRIYVVDRRGAPVPRGVAGELTVGGACLARGYSRGPRATAERFVPDGTSGEAGGRLYRTGDQARRRSTGDVVFLGRLDHQVKIRGFRIELGEIEEVLREHDSVRQAVADLRPLPGQAEERHLMAWVVPATESLELDDLMSWLRAKVPEFMVPAQVVSLDRLPLGHGGKVDRSQLPDATDQIHRQRSEFLAPRNQLERDVAKIWKRVLDVDKVGANDNFFDLGGHSLLLLQVYETLRERYDPDLAMVEMFHYPTVAALAKRLAGDEARQAATAVPPDPEKAASHGGPSASAGAIAIIGIAGRFPGARDVDELWRNLRNGVESITFFAEEELLAAGVDAALLERSDYVPAKAVLEGVEDFDAGFFGFTPREAELTDPQHRFFLECCWEALENAGYDAGRHDGDIGLFGGAGVNSYLMLHLATNPELVETAGLLQTLIHNKNDHLCTRVGYKLDLRGPCVTVQTACSTSLVAVSLACQSLIDGGCDMALAGGSTIVLPQISGYLYQEGGIASPDGHCRAFDAEAAGTVDGNGTGVVVLKRLDDALRDGDSIRAVIKGWALNNDGALKAGYTAPSIERQAEVIAEAHRIAGVAPETLSYVEAHGTGTPLGDPVEVAALTRAFRLGATEKEDAERRGYCAVGSIKSNFGHLDAAAGVAGLIKTILSLENGAIPPTLHFNEPNPRTDFAASPFYVNAELLPWPRDQAPRRAGVSSFGIGGTNAHMILEEAPNIDAEVSRRSWQLLPFSARTPSALESASENLAAHLRRQPDLDMADVAYTLQAGRKVFSHRRVAVCRDVEDAAVTLETLDPERVFTRAQEPVERPVIFMFPGQGSQYVGMAEELYATEPVFRRRLDRCAELLTPHLELDLRELLYPAAEAREAASRQLDQTALTQPALFAVEFALAGLWMEWGVVPRAMTGHSLGELVAACLAGVMTLEEGLALISARGRLIQSLPEGAMLSVAMSEREVRRLIEEPLALAAVNSPSLCAVSGPTEKIDELARRLDAEGTIVRRLRSSHAFHSSLMEPILDAFATEVKKVALKPPEIPFLSNISGTWITPEEATDPNYWVRHVRQTVRFNDGVEELLKEPEAVLVEVGPGRTLKTVSRWHPKKATDQVVETSLPHPGDAITADAALQGSVGRLWLAGVEIDWRRYHGEARRRIPLPTYPFERQRYWIEARQSSMAARPIEGLEKRADLADWFHVPVWRQTPPPISPAGAGEAPGRWLLLIDDLGLGQRLAERFRRQGATLVVVEVGETFELVDEEPDLRYTLHPGRRDDYRELLADLARRGALPAGIVHLWNVTTEEEAPAAGVEAWSVFEDSSFYSLLHLIQAWGEEKAAGAVSLTVVANGLQSVAGEPLWHPERAALYGPVKVTPQEYPEIACSSVDVSLPPNGGGEREADELMAELAAASGDRVVAWRAGRRWVQGFEPMKLPLDGPVNRLRTSGVYLITGGLGGVGLAVAGMIAEQAEARLALLGRSSFPEPAAWDDWLARHAEDEPTSRKIRRLRELEIAGAEILVLSADVTDEEQMRAAVAALRSRFGRLDGVFHAAGIAGGGLMQLRSREASASVFAPKIIGTRVLEKVLADTEIEALVLFSSLAGVVGRLGQVDYSAANAFLDAFAGDFARRTGVYTVAVDWGEWHETGMAASETLPQASLAKAPTERLDHPLLERRTALPSGEEIFATDFDVHKHWVIDEHRLVGNPVIPGVAYIEMVLAALGERAEDRMIELHDFYFVAPLRVRDDQTREVRLRLSSGDGGSDGLTYRFSIESDAEEDEGEASGVREYAMGEVRLLAPRPPEHCDLTAIRKQCDQREEIFTDEEREDDLGPRWQNVQRAWVGENRVLTHLALPEAFAPDFEIMKYHPSMMDRAAGVAKEYLYEGTYLPLSYKTLRIHARVPREIYTWAQHDPGADPSLETLIYDTRVLDPDGRVLVELEGFSQKLVTDAAVKIKSYAGHGDWGHTLQRQSAPSDERETAKPDAIEPSPQRREMLPEEGVEALRRILAGPAVAQVAVSVRDLEAAIERAADVAQERILEETAKRRPAGVAHPRPDLATEYVAPAGEFERRLATVWQEVLGIERVGIHDGFFDLGGDSVQAIQIIAALGRSGLEVTPQEFFQHQTIAQLVAGVETAEEAPVSGPIPITGTQLRYLEPIANSAASEPRSWLLVAHTEADPDLLMRALPQVVEIHPALGIRIAKETAGWRQAAGGAIPWSTCDLSALPAERRTAEATAVTAAVGELPLDPRLGPGARFVVLGLGAGEASRLLTGLHPTVADITSWRILLDDLEEVCRQLAAGQEATRLPSPVPFAQWARRQAEAAESLTEKLDAWAESLPATPRSPFDLQERPSETSDGEVKDPECFAVTLPRNEALNLVEEVSRAYRASAEDAVLTALSRVCLRMSDDALFLDAESDVRGMEAGEPDLTRTVGPLTAVSPLLLEVAKSANPGEALKAIKESRRRVPGSGTGFDLLRDLAARDGTREWPREQARPVVIFRYREAATAPRDGLLVPQPPPPKLDPGYLLGVEAILDAEGLRLSWTYRSAQLDGDDIRELASATVAALEELISHCRSQASASFTPSDFPLADLDDAALGQLESLVKEMDDPGTAR